jgi:hypothetical protein
VIEPPHLWHRFAMQRGFDDIEDKMFGTSRQARGNFGYFAG